MNQNDLFSPVGKEDVFPMSGGGQIRCISPWLNSEKANALFAELDREITWQQPQIIVYGTQRPIPRLQAWYGDTGASMIYSGKQFDPLDWIPALSSVREKIQQQFNCAFNSVLVNKYRDGEDSVGWHADDEAELGRNPVIASLSLGAVRKFSLKPKPKSVVAAAKAFSMYLKQGDLLLMSGEVQQHWLHAILKEKNLYEPRINLTFRQIVKQSPRLPNKANML